IASEIKETLKPIIRIATPDDIERARELREKAKERAREARQDVDELGLDMRIVGGDIDLQEKQLTLYFTAPERVDFRELVRKLSSRFGMRVQLLQVGERDRAKIVDGIGRCGERLCCASWLTSFPTVSIRMAKEQELPLNPSKISGACGRLLCCLTYEYEMYRELRGQLPKVGTMVSTPVGDAKVTQLNVLKQTVVLTLVETGATLEVPVVDMQLQFGVTVRPLELVETFERPMQRAEAQAAGMPAPAEVAPAETEPQKRRRRRRKAKRQESAAAVVQAGATTGASTSQPSGDAERRRRRRGRRGGRRRGRGRGGSGAQE
ncbi:MAG TPA: regulatory iron-sulfur-containing complex subunit RicT, partial [Dehalococcoidia bacterium]|nr:regulatory iron-sulfur-containing complex subunit RicT [Dehalococcoidia bacterium]